MPVKHLLSLITLALFMAANLSANAATKELTWAGCGISKKGFMNDLAKAYEKKTGVKINIAGGGATKGLRHVAAGKINMGGSCRLPLVFKKDDGTTQVLGIERNLNVIPVGWDALVTIVNKENKMIDSITTAQLKDLFTGKITNWKQLDGKTDKPINLYIRKGKISGVGLTLRQQLFNNTDQNFAKSAKILKSSGKIETALEKDPYGIAVSGISSRIRRSRIRRGACSADLQRHAPVDRIGSTGSVTVVKICNLHPFSRVRRRRRCIPYSQRSMSSPFRRTYSSTSGWGRTWNRSSRRLSTTLSARTSASMMPSV